MDALMSIYLRSIGECYANSVHNRAIPAGWDLPGLWPEWVPPFHSHAATGGASGSVHAGDLWLGLLGRGFYAPGDSGGPAVGQSVCSPGAHAAWSGDCEYVFLSPLHGAQRLA